MSSEGRLLEQDEEWPEENEFYGLLAEYGRQLNLGAEVGKNGSLVDSISRQKLDKWEDKGLISSHYNRDIKIYEPLLKDEEFAMELARYVEENYRDVNQFKEEYNHEDVEKIRDFSIKYIFQ